MLSPCKHIFLINNWYSISKYYNSVLVFPGTCNRFLFFFLINRLSKIAERELRDAIKEMDHDRINRELLNEGADYLVIKWKRNQPSASHMGGIWGRQIRSIRAILSALFKVHGTSLNDEALRTFMAEATGILNSRPLTIDNLNSPDCLPLSPNNLLTMKTKVVLPPPGNFPRADIYWRKYWRRVQNLADEFWNRRRKEYLQNQQKRTKWYNQRANLKF